MVLCRLNASERERERVKCQGRGLIYKCTEICGLARLCESRACQGKSHATWPTYFPAYLLLPDMAKEECLLCENYDVVEPAGRAER